MEHPVPELLAPNPIDLVTRAYAEGRAAILLTGRPLDDLVVDPREQKLRPIREVLRRQLRTQHGLALITFTLAAGLDWDAPRLDPGERQFVEDALRAHRLTNPTRDPREVPRLLQSIAVLCRDSGNERRWSDGTSARFAWLCEFAEHLVPGGLANGSQTDAQIASIEIVTKLIASLALRSSGNLVIFHGREGLIDPLVVAGLHQVHLAQPDFDEKLTFLQAGLQVYSKATFAEGLTLESVARLVSRTPNRSQEARLRASHRTGTPIATVNLVAEKIRDVEQISECTLTALDTSRVDGVTLLGRNIAVVRDFLQKCGKALGTGDATTPTNIILAGAPGQGKTDLALELARTAHASAFEVQSPKGGIVGETERRARLQRRALTEWTPNVGIIDEITDSMPLARGAFNTDGGASDAVSASLLTLLSDEGRRGKSIIIGTTNRPQCMSGAMRSRFEFIPVLAPLLTDLPAIIVAMAKRLAPTAKVDASQPLIIEAAAIFYKKGVSPREIARSFRTPITPKSILEAARNICPTSDLASSSYAELWAIKACSSQLLFPWYKDPAGYPYPPHLAGLVDPETGELNRVELDNRIRELAPHEHV